MLKHNHDSRKAWRDARKVLKMQYSRDSFDLFNAVIKRMQSYLAIGGDIDSIVDFYHNEASHLVNSDKSRFYIYGR